MSTERTVGRGSQTLPVGPSLALLAGVGFAALAVIDFEGPARVLFGALAVFFLPGYAAVVALFPRRQVGSAVLERLSGEIEGVEFGDGVTVSATERLVLSVGLSLGLVPLVGLIMDLTFVPLRADTLLPAVGVTTAVLAFVGILRWYRVPRESRFALPVYDVVTRSLGRGAGGTRIDVLLNLVLVLGLVVAGSGIAYAVADAENGERFTELYLLGTDPETGDRVAGELPGTLTQGEPVALYVGLTNYEGRTVDYTVVVLLQEIRDVSGSELIGTEEELARFSVRLGPGETSEELRPVEPTFTGEDLRVTYLLYRGEPPAEPTLDSAYRQVHFWADVTPGTADAEVGR